MVGRRKDKVHFDLGSSSTQGDHGILLSNDGTRVVSSLVNMRPEKRTHVEDVDVLGDVLGDWMPVPVDSFQDFSAVADTVSSFAPTFVHQIEEHPSLKRKRYQSSDEPMSVWRPLAPFFLDQMFWGDGLGDYVRRPACTLCDKAYNGKTTRLFRCTQCGQFLQCEQCVRKMHKYNPLHILREWNGKFWQEAALHRLQPEGLGEVYQLGHHGFPCERPGPVRSMVVIDTKGVFKLQIRLCRCEKEAHANNLAQILRSAWYPATTIDPETCATFEALELFRLLNVVGNVNAYDFVGTLERLTDPTGVGGIPDRYKAFSRMSRQYNYLKRAKRAGRGHETDGLQTTKPGGLAVQCWACPAPGRNLPDNWRNAKPEDRFLYSLPLALDANFRLKNRIRANEHQDASLGPGQGYFVEPTAYKEHLRHHSTEKDVSTCIAFAALLQKETRITTGLRVSGVAGCVCARHGVVRPLGLGDLQKGERYANMDHVLLSALEGVEVERLVFSYDIACQWKVHLLERAKALTEKANISTRLDKFDIQFGLPVWHAAVHELKCRMANSLSFAKGVGRTDGEGIERTWSILNPIGFATKEMGEGGRHDNIEDKVDHVNFEKNVGQGDALARKIIVAVNESQKQTAEFNELNESITSGLRRKWQGKIDAWEADPATAPNPYLVEGGTQAGPTEAQVSAELAANELEEARQGRVPIPQGKMTVVAFIKIGLNLRQSQLRIRADLKGSTLTADVSGQIHEQRVAWLKKAKTWEKLQETYMPGVAELRRAEEESRDADVTPPQAEHVKLYLPSDLTPAQRRTACRPYLVEVEARLRYAHCATTIATLRSRLHAQAHIVAFRNEFIVGQKASTRSAMLIGRVGDRVGRVAAKYREARAALTALKGPQYAKEFRELKDEDLTVQQPDESDARSLKKLSRAGSSRRARNEPTLAPSKVKRLSWIFTVGGEASEAEVHDSIRVEWSKARARRDRWNEEVRFLREEMKRVLRSLATVQAEWERRAVKRGGVEEGLEAGLKAYALRQVSVHRKIAEVFYRRWSKSMIAAVQDVLTQDEMALRSLLCTGKPEESEGMDPEDRTVVEDIEGGSVADEQNA
ncbi:hypothetical protein GGX14DRAFT_564781 [Mycena pura]|uniref:CxC2-like cysteine cluster KDZ transposase-associated domain-containing protein n=1 Tax=Mycena pura TaxID=153505 RepID=A0AAD6YGI9_9AGAR|nr:hypothetical protein GGX14DRAFT_564781 [Mycena pura]